MPDTQQDDFINLHDDVRLEVARLTIQAGWSLEDIETAITRLPVLIRTGRRLGDPIQGDAVPGTATSDSAANSPA